MDNGAPVASVARPWRPTARPLDGRRPTSMGGARRCIDARRHAAAFPRRRWFCPSLRAYVSCLRRRGRPDHLDTPLANARRAGLDPTVTDPPYPTTAKHPAATPRDVDARGMRVPTSLPRPALVASRDGPSPNTAVLRPSTVGLPTDRLDLEGALVAPWSVPRASRAGRATAQRPTPVQRVDLDARRAHTCRSTHWRRPTGRRRRALDALRPPAGRGSRPPPPACPRTVRQQAWPVLAEHRAAPSRVLQHGPLPQQAGGWPGITS